MVTDLTDGSYIRVSLKHHLFPRNGERSQISSQGFKRLLANCVGLCSFIPDHCNFIPDYSNFIPDHCWIKLSGVHVYCVKGENDEEFRNHHENNNDHLVF